MKAKATEQPIPSTPLRIFVRSDQMYDGPFFVQEAGLDEREDLREIDDAEVDALAHIIYNAYLECKTQSPTSEFPANAK